ncbi:MAG: DUF2190 family protein [Thermoguttaceae bacterium]|nr:DUF2190 family protein [Thermoguttaceae bacterium]
MSAIFRGSTTLVPITPTASLSAGAVVKISDNLVVITHQAIAANTQGYGATRGTYDVDITAGTAYDVGALVTVPAKTLAGESTTAVVGPALKAVLATDTTARVMLEGVNMIQAAAADAGSGSGSGSGSGGT